MSWSVVILALTVAGGIIVFAMLKVGGDADQRFKPPVVPTSTMKRRKH